MLKFRSDGGGGGEKPRRPISTSSTASFNVRPPLPRRHRKDRRLSSLVDDTGRTSAAHSPATLDDTNVSIASEAADSNSRQPRSRSADYRFFDGDELKTPINTYKSYSRFADISLAPDEVFDGEIVGGDAVGASMSSIPGIMRGGKASGNSTAIGSTLQLNPLELADVCLSTTSTSLQHSSTSPFTLAAMRKRDRENARYLVTIPTHLFTMVLCFCMCYKNLAGAPAAFYANGRGAAVVVHAFLTLVIVLPLAHLQFALGRVTRLNPYAIFSGGSPLTRGVGMAMVAHAVVVLWANGPPMVHALTYVFSSLQHQLPWDPCSFYGEVTLECRYGDEKWTSELVSPPERLSNSHCLRRGCQEAIMQRTTSYSYWSQGVLAEGSIVAPLQIWVFAFFSWLFVCGCSVASVRRGLLSMWVASTTCVCVFFLAMAAQFFYPDRPVRAMTTLFQIPPDQMWSIEVWSTAARVALGNTILLSGPMIFLGSMTKEKERHISWEITLAILLSLVCQLLVYASTFRVHSHALPTAAAFLNDYDFTFGVIPGLLANNRVANLLFFFTLFLSEAASCSFYLRHISVALLSAKLLSSEQRLPICSSLLCVIVGLCGSMLFLAGTHGRDLHTAVTRYTAIPPLIAITPCWLMLLLFYGPSNLGGSFTSVKNFELYKWFLRVVLVLLSAMTFVFGIMSITAADSHNMSDLPTWTKVIALVFLIAIIAQLVTYPSYRLARAAMKGHPLGPETRIALAEEECTNSSRQPFTRTRLEPDRFFANVKEETESNSGRKRSVSESATKIINKEENNKGIRRGSMEMYELTSTPYLKSILI